MVVFLYFHQQCRRVSITPYPHQHLVWSISLILDIKYKIIFHSFNLHFSDGKHFLMCLLVSLFFSSASSSLLPCFLILGLSFHYWFIEFFMFSGYASFVRNMYCECFLPVCGFPFHFLNGDFFFLIKSNLSVSFIVYTFCVLSKKSVIRSQKYSVFIWKLVGLAFMFRSMLCLGLCSLLN